MTYIVRVTNMPNTEVRIGRQIDAIAYARELHAEHPNRWVDVRNEDNDLILLLDPTRLFSSAAIHTQLTIEDPS